MVVKTKTVLPRNRKSLHFHHKSFQRNDTNYYYYLLIMPATTVLLPHQDTDKLFLTDGGLETTLVFLEGFELPHFAAIDMLRTDKGQDWLRAYYRKYASMAQERGAGNVLETVTWRSSAEWCDKIGYAPGTFEDINKQAVQLCREIAAEYPNTPMVVSGCIGPRGDGYKPEELMSADEAHKYHQTQVDVLAEAGVDVITAMTFNYIDEAIGITRAAKTAGKPVVISFTVETDGCLPTGETLKEAIEQVDEASDGVRPDYYMINCAHPTHFRSILVGQGDAAWALRIGGIRANASKCSHAELDECEELDDGNPVELGQEYRDILPLLPMANVLGGCCGTDHRHIEQICHTCAPLFENK